MEGDRIQFHPSRDSLWLPTSPCAPSLQGANCTLLFENSGGGEVVETLEMPLAQAIVKGENWEEEELDMSLTQPTKKRRLTSKQLEFLESNFALENKLEPERKLQLAMEIGLQPRQVAIWFQNRRARFKNKQLEKDYDSLKGSFEKLKAEFECLVKEKESLESEVSSLKGKLAGREKELMLETLEPLELESYYPPQSTTPREAGEGEKSCKLPAVTNTPKQEDASSAKSDVFDSDSPLSFLVPDQSDHFSQDEEEDHQTTTSCYFLSSSPPKLCPDPSPDSCNYGFPVEDLPFWTWTSYGGMYYY